jgi:hypothetical protein
MIAKTMMRLALAIAVLAAFASRALLAVPAYADHESRDRILSGVGVEVFLFALVLFGALVMIVAFAAGILWWERQDADVSDTEQRNSVD